MELILRAGGGERRVAVRRRGEGWEVTLDGATHRVDAVHAGDGLLSLLIEGAQHEVAVHREGAGRYWVAGARNAVAVEVTDPLTHLARESHRAAGATGLERVTAYMPGRVAAILVEEGEEVAAGQGVMVLEAMKMENEIQTERPGTIRRLLVEPGQAVEGGQPLFEIE